MTKINFRAFNEDIYKYAPHPEPMATAMPDWFKNMRSHISHPNNIEQNDVFSNYGQLEYGMTLKRCPPVQQMINMGYVIRTHCDLAVECDRENDVLNFNWQGDDFNAVGTHTRSQVQSSPIEKFAQSQKIFKWMNLWFIHTSPGYSCIFTAPQYQDLPMIALSGVVQTDKWHEVNFPFVYNGPDGRSVIRAGTPIAQVIPFKRETHTSSVSFVSEKELKSWKSRTSMFFSKAYRKVMDKAMKFK
jgi:hypothetical protein